jgi:hypothetical protein
VSKTVLTIRSRLLLLAAFLALSALFPATVCPDTLPVPVVKFPFDVSRQNSALSQDFRIVEHRTYEFSIRFEYTSRAVEDRLLEVLTGRPSHKRGIPIPLHVRLLVLNPASKTYELIDENTVLTQDYITHELGVPGAFTRQIIAVDLKPGTYRIQVNTLQDSREFQDMPSYLQIGYDARLKFFPNRR